MVRVHILAILTGSWWLSDECMNIICLFYQQEGHFLTAGDSLRDLESQTHRMTSSSSSSSSGQWRTAAAQKRMSPPCAPLCLRHTHLGPRWLQGCWLWNVTHLHTRLVCVHTSRLLKWGKEGRGLVCVTEWRVGMRWENSEAPTVCSCSEAGRRRRLACVTFSYVTLASMDSKPV